MKYSTESHRLPVECLEFHHRILRGSVAHHAAPRNSVENPIEFHAIGKYMM